MLGMTERGKKRLAYGLWRYTEDQVEVATQMVSLARESGIDHFDTADIYGGVSGFGGSERLLGAIRRKSPKLFDGATVATKAGCDGISPYQTSPAYLKAACDGSMSRLGVERIELFYIHRPDLLAHPADVAGALDDLVATGKIAAVGVSNHSVPQVEALARYMKTPIRVHQIEFSAGHVAPLFDGTLDQAMKRHMAVAAWSPMAGGRLGASGQEGLVAVRAVLARLAAQHSVMPTAIAMAFLLMHPASITPILGSKRPERLGEALAGLTVNLSRREWYDVVEAARGQRMP